MYEKSVKNITDTIVREFKPEKVVLFGSYAWGKPTKNSDIDLLIVKDDPKKIPEKWLLILSVFY